jgi:Fe-S-cluster containining protein
MSAPKKNGYASGANGATRANGASGDGHDSAKAKPVVQYNCAKCPGYCCSYPVITVTKRDLSRLAKYFNITEAEAEARYCKSQHGYKRILRRKKDEHFGMTCQFFDTEKRRCTIYEGRPTVCRSYPGGGRCGYYDFLSFERRAQNDPEFVALTDHA